MEFTKIFKELNKLGIKDLVAPGVSVSGKNELSIDRDYRKRCLALSPEQRLKELEKLNRFMSEAVPEASKEAWLKLKEKGF